MLDFWESRVFCPVMDSEGFFLYEECASVYNNYLWVGLDMLMSLGGRRTGGAGRA